MRYLLLLLLPLSIYASKILSYNIYERSDRADVMITFDTPYSGTIKQSNRKNKIIIKLEGASIESTKLKKVNSAYLHSLTITPLKDKTQITAYTSQNVRFIASKTSDAYGLRLRFTHKALANPATTKKSSFHTNLSALPTKKDGEMSKSYYIVVAILIIGILTLLFIKKRVTNVENKEKDGSWLFNNTQEKVDTKETKAAPKSTNVVSIRFQKAIDSTNSVVMLDFGEESYLVLMGNSNILLEKFRDIKPNTQQEFDSILQKRNQQLEDFLESPKEQIKEPLQAYKERAASLVYGENE